MAADSAPPSRGYAATKDQLGVLDDHVRHCVMAVEGAEQVDKTDELMAAVGRLTRRG